MRVLVYGMSVLLALLGLVFLIAAGQGNALVRVLIALVCLGAAATLVVLTRLRPVTVTQKLDLSGNVSLENITCRKCGATLSSKSLRVSAGAVFVECEYCGNSYQLEEDPKW